MYKYSIMADKKRSKKPIMIIASIWIVLIIVILSSGLIKLAQIKSINKTEFTIEVTFLRKDSDYKKASNKHKIPLKYKNNKLSERDQQDLDGSREANVKVDVGFDDPYATRDYWGYTNKHEQLVFVEADKIIIQNDTLEAEWMEGGNRYSDGVAKVEESETWRMQKGHVIADSLGGTSTAYNVCPEDETLNTSINPLSPQRDLETKIKKNGEKYPDDPTWAAAENFRATMYYTNKKTNTPSKYYVSFIMSDEFWEYTFSNNDEFIYIN